MTLNLPDRIEAVLALDPGADALQVDGRWTSWGQLARGGNSIQAALGRAAREGAAIGVIMRNDAPTVAAALSLLTHRQQIVTLSTMQPLGHLAREVGHLQLSAVVADSDVWSDDDLRTAVRECGAAAVAIERDLSAARAIEPCTLAPEDLAARTAPGVAVMMSTSGTTGAPRRIPLKLDSLARGFADVAHYERDGGTDAKLRGGVAVIAIPLLHIGGLWSTLLNVLSGRRVCLLERFDVDAWSAAVERHRPRTAGLPPTALRMLLDAEIAPARLESLCAVTVGTAPVKPELQARFESTYDLAVLVVYGATEFAGGVAGWTLADHHEWSERKRGSVGRPHPGVELQIIDPDSRAPICPGETGLLRVRTPQVVASEPDGFTTTTDLATLDSDGFLWIRGRADDAIIRGGFKISAGAVAEVLKDHPAVADAAVVGLPDDRLGEVPVAAVEAHGVLDSAELVRWARTRLAPYQVPARVVVVDALPRTPSMKVSQPALRELLTSMAAATGHGDSTSGVR